MSRSDIDKLTEFGFTKIADFHGGEDLIELKREGGLPAFITSHLNQIGDKAKVRNVIYASVVDGIVTYLGETERDFKSRYRNHIDNLVNFALNGKPAYLRWVEFFKTVGHYEIWQMKAPEIEVLGLKVNVRQDFETALIGVFNPVMNTRTKGMKAD